MPLMPKRVKYRKTQRGSRAGTATRTIHIDFGSYALQTLERAWVALNRGKSVSTQDFIALASRISGQNLRGFLNDWLYGTKTPPMPGHPDWTVTPPPAPSSAAGTTSAPAAKALVSHR